MKQLNLNQLRLVRGAEGSGGGDGVNPPETYTTSNRGTGGGGVTPPITRSSGSGGGDGVEPPKANVALLDWTDFLLK